jgi:hypothetical protein
VRKEEMKKQEKKDDDATQCFLRSNPALAAGFEAGILELQSGVDSERRYVLNKCTCMKYNLREGSDTISSTGDPLYDPEINIDGQHWEGGKDAHLSIGITVRGLEQVLTEKVKIIDSIVTNKKGKILMTSSYQRDMSNDSISWNKPTAALREQIERTKPKFIPPSWSREGAPLVNDFIEVTGAPNGYDTTLEVGQYLRTTNNQHLSLNEVLLREGSTEVGTENVVFFSHVQQLPLEVTLQSLRDAIQMHSELTEDTKFWVDYTALRQCQQDFDLAQVQVAICAMRATLIELDCTYQFKNSDEHLDPVYLRRLFCIFESFATTTKGKEAKLLVCGPAVTNAPKAAGVFAAAKHGYSNEDNTCKDICDSARAKCRDPQATYKIRHDIESSVGFDAVNKAIAAAVRDGVIKGLRYASVLDPTQLNVAGMIGKHADKVTNEDIARALLTDGTEKREPIRVLNLEQCTQVTELPGGFRNRFGQLQELHANLAGLQKLPFSIGDLHSLTKLFLERNALSEIPHSIGNLQSLEILSLLNNPLREIPPTIGNLVSLQELNCGFCELTDLPAMVGCTSLTNVNLQSNTQLDAVGMESFFTNPPPNLATLSLPRCGLEFLSESIGSLTTLVWLGIDYNRLSVLPSSIGNLQSLRRLWLEGNLLSDAEKVQAQKSLPNCAIDVDIEYER